MVAWKACTWLGSLIPLLLPGKVLCCPCMTVTLLITQSESKTHVRDALKCHSARES